jgi:hypothetical protein
MYHLHNTLELCVSAKLHTDKHTTVVLGILMCTFLDKRQWIAAVKLVHILQ